MRWRILILVTLGLLAALCAAVLSKTLRVNDASAGATLLETEVLLAAKAMPAMSVLQISSVTVQSVPKERLPKGYLSNPVQAVGKVLAAQVVEGQVLTESCFVENGVGAQMAASLPAGMRAVVVSLSSTSISGGLLYPGCVVDVLASFKLPSSERGQALSTTLLRGIQVLAVQGTTVASQDEEEKKTSNRLNTQRMTVTLMVDPKQAEALQLATSHGSVSLALRNPLDDVPVDTEVTVLSQGRLAQLGSAMTAAVIGGNGEENGGSAQEEQASEGNAGAPAGKTSWPVTVIRGAQVQQHDLDAPRRAVLVGTGS